MMHPADQDPKDFFIECVQKSIKKGTFVKLTLSKSNVKEDGAIQNIYGRLVELKKGRMLSCTLRYATQDITKNYSTEELKKQLLEWLPEQFAIATFFSTEETLTLQYNRKFRARLIRTKATAVLPAEETVQQHNKSKQYLIAENSPFLALLDVSSQNGLVLPAQQDKFRQINKFVEIMQALYQQTPTLQEKKPIKVIDMGSGKGYLTFALFDYWYRLQNLDVNIKGIELRNNLTSFCNAQAQKLGWSNRLSFEALDILEYKEQDFDILIALHACDTATDIAIAHGIRNEAQVIVTAPCCQKQIRRQLQPQGPWQEVLKHGILMERQAELLTDSIRGLLLEAAGYKVKIFEFISQEHTSKNIMITATKMEHPIEESRRQHCLEQVALLKAGFGIEQHFLESLL